MKHLTQNRLRSVCLLLLFCGMLLPACLLLTGAPPQPPTPPLPGAALQPAASPVPSSTPVSPTETPTQTPPPSVTEQAAGIPGWVTYSNATYGFGFEYPLEGIVSYPEGLVLRVDLPHTPGTNLAEKYLEVSVRPGVSPCHSPQVEGMDPSQVNPQPVQINGQTWLQEAGGGVAAGNLYENTSYSLETSGACLSLAFILHYSDPGIFSTPPPEFDRAAESAVFPQVMGTVKVSP